MAERFGLVVVGRDPAGCLEPEQEPYRASFGLSSRPRAVPASSSGPAGFDEGGDLVDREVLALLGDDEAHALEGLGWPGRDELPVVRARRKPRPGQQLQGDPRIQRVLARVRIRRVAPVFGAGA